MSVLLILIDACREDNITPELTPFIYTLKQKGGYSRLDFLSSFNARVELLTGNSPITTDTMYDYCIATEKSKLGLLRYLPTPSRLKKGNKTREYLIWRIGSRLRRFFTGSNVGIAPNIPLSLLPYFTINSSFDRFIEKEQNLSTEHLFGKFENNGIKHRFICSFAKNITADIKENPPEGNFALFLHYEDLDMIGHEHGPYSAKKETALQAIDSSVEQIYRRFQDEIDFIAVFGDHNMEEVQVEFDLWAELQKLKLRIPKDYLVFLNSPVARFWFNNEKARTEIREFLKTLDKYGREITADELTAKGLSADSKYGECIFWLKKGVNIRPDFYHESEIKGMHHYFDDPAWTPFILFHKDRQIKLRNEGKLRDVMPTVLELLGIESNVDGKSLFIKE
ncbi:MAG: alkaline phosphatase family protein [Dehalococcoidales bacterium]|nr:alkaline phosphatase family protein [Dehalococcoidales bacterium]